MKITITIKNEQDGKSYDVSLDNRQKIATTLKVMSENLPEFMKGIGTNPAPGNRWCHIRCQVLAG